MPPGGSIVALAGVNCQLSRAVMKARFRETYAFLDGVLVSWADLWVRLRRLVDYRSVPCPAYRHLFSGQGRPDCSGAHFSAGRCHRALGGHQTGCRLRLTAPNSNKAAAGGDGQVRAECHCESARCHSSGHPQRLTAEAHWYQIAMPPSVHQSVADGRLSRYSEDKLMQRGKAVQSKQLPARTAAADIEIEHPAAH